MTKEQTSEEDFQAQKDAGELLPRVYFDQMKFQRDHAVKIIQRLIDLKDLISMRDVPVNFETIDEIQAVCGLVNWAESFISSLENKTTNHERRK